MREVHVVGVGGRIPAFAQRHGLSGVCCASGWLEVVRMRVRWSA